MSEHLAQQPAPQQNYVATALAFFEEMGPAEAIVYSGRRYSYDEVRAAVLAMAGALRNNGVRGGMTVVAVTKNHPESIILQLALHLLGCRTGFVAIYAPLRDQLDFVSYAEADVLIHDPGMSGDLITAVLARGERPVLSLGPEEGRPDLLAEMVVAAAQPGGPAAGADGAGEQQASPVGEPQSLFYTSGTTGQPKVVLHKEGFYKALYLGGQFYRASGEPPMRHLGIPAFATTSGQMPAMLALFQGGAIILLTVFKMDEFLATIGRERITSTFLSPLRMQEVLGNPDLADVDTSTLRYLNCGGGGVSAELMTRAIERFGPVLRTVYGMTEMPLITDYPFMDIDPAHPGRLASAGKPFADARIEVRDEQGNVLPPGETGEVWATGTLIMDGYVGQPELTSRMVVDGWLRTEDVGYTDADGYLYIVDRSRDVIITGKGTVKVYSRVVEDVLVSHPAVRAAAVIGVPDEELGEAVHAYVMTTPGASVTTIELHDLVASELKEVYAPRDIEFVPELPLTPMDKVDKKVLRARYHGQ
jgi:fatty-acyl-CoA synthase